MLKLHVSEVASSASAPLVCGAQCPPHASFHTCTCSQEQYALKESFKKAVAQDLRRSFRDSAVRVLSGSRKVEQELQSLPGMLPEEMQTGGNQVRNTTQPPALGRHHRPRTRCKPEAHV